MNLGSPLFWHFNFSVSLKYFSSAVVQIYGRCFGNKTANFIGDHEKYRKPIPPPPPALGFPQSALGFPQSALGFPTDRTLVSSLTNHTVQINLQDEITCLLEFFWVFRLSVTHCRVHDRTNSLFSSVPAAESLPLVCWETEIIVWFSHNLRGFFSQIFPGQPAVIATITTRRKPGLNFFSPQSTFRGFLFFYRCPQCNTTRRKPFYNFPSK